MTGIKSILYSRRRWRRDQSIYRVMCCWI